MFRFTIRDVLWLTLVVAMGVGWFAEHRLLTRWTWTTRVPSEGLLPGDQIEIELTPSGEVRQSILREMSLESTVP